MTARLMAAAEDAAAPNALRDLLAALARLLPRLRPTDGGGRQLRLRLPGRLMTAGFGSGSAPACRAAAALGTVLARASIEPFAERRAVEVYDAPPKLAAELAARAATPIAPPAASVIELADAIVRDGIVETAAGTIVADSLINLEPDAGIARTAPRLSIVRRLSGRPHVLLKQRWDANYGHWLVEGLPRLALVEERFRLSDLGFIVSAHHGPMQEIYEDSLALFGIRRDQIVEVGTEPIAVDHLVYPTPMTRHPWHIAPRCVEVLEEMATRVRADRFGSERIYVSRNGAGRRRLLNEDEIVAVVERRGFTVVEPEALSLYGQIGLFRNARIVVGNYGAALTNVAFAAGAPTLFALTTEFMQDDFFSTLMSLKRGRYLSLHGRAAGERGDMNADFHVDAHRFAAILDGLL